MAFILDADRPLPDNAQRDIEAFVKNSDKILRIMDDFSTKSPDFTPAPVFNRIAGELSTTYSEVSRMFTALEAIVDIQQNVGGADEVVTLLLKRLTPERAVEVDKHKSDIMKLLALYSKDHPIVLSIKAEKLSYLHENLYQDAEIITDARPVFGSDGTSVVEFIVTHSLVLNHYSFGSGTKRVHFSMDAADVSRLKEACERAETKAASLKSALGGSWPVRVLNERGSDA